MRMAAGPSSLVETREALLIQVRSGGICAATPPEPACGGGRVPPAGDRQVGEPAAKRDAAAIKAFDGSSPLLEWVRIPPPDPCGKLIDKAIVA